MPNNLIKSLSKKTGKSTSEVENDWEKSKEIAKKSSKTKNFYGLANYLTQRMAGSKEK